jgi:opacity protein-like surface antigen
VSPYKYTPQYANADFTLGLYAGYTSAFDFDFANKFGFTLGLEDHVPYNFGLVGGLSLDYLTNKTEPDSRSTLILGLTIGYQFFSNFVVYAGGGVGAQFTADDVWFAWKVNGGLRVQVKRFFTRIDVSYYLIIGPALGLGLGIFL